MITKEQAYESSERYLIENIGNLVGSGEPIFDSKIGVWVVPVFHMSKIAVFPVGEIVMGEEGNVLYAPTSKEIDNAFEKKLENNDELKGKFQLKIQPF